MLYFCSARRMVGIRERETPTLLVVLREDGGKYDGWRSSERSSGFQTFSDLISDEVESKTGGSSSTGDGSSSSMG